MFQPLHRHGRYFTLDNLYIVASAIVILGYLVYFLMMR
jgi:hypothetical protein